MWAALDVEQSSGRRGDPARGRIVPIMLLSLAAAAALSWQDPLGLAGPLARYASVPTLLDEVEATGPAGNPQATAEVVARLCDGRLTGDEARRAVVALWLPHVMMCATALPGEEMPISSRLLMPLLDAPRDDGPVLAWRLVEVRVDDGEPIAFDAPPSLMRLASGEDFPRSDAIRLPADSAPGRTCVSCVFEYELRGVAGAPRPWRQTFDRRVVVFAADG